MKKYLITAVLLAGLGAPLLTYADATTTQASPIATTSAQISPRSLCIEAANKTFTEAKASAKEVYDAVKASALTLRNNAVTASNALPRTSILEKKIILRDAASAYKTAITTASKTLEAKRLDAHTAQDAALLACEEEVKASKKAAPQMRSMEMRSMERKVEKTTSREEAKVMRADIKAKVGDIRAEGKKKIEDIRKNNKARVEGNLRAN